MGFFLSLVDAGYIETPGKPIESYNKSTTTSSMVSQDSVFPPPTSGQTPWSLQCAETSHFNGFLAPEYASTPTVICCEALRFHNSGLMRRIDWLTEKSFCRCCHI